MDLTKFVDGPESVLQDKCSRAGHRFIEAPKDFVRQVRDRLGGKNASDGTTGTNPVFYAVSKLGRPGAVADAVFSPYPWESPEHNVLMHRFCPAHESRYDKYQEGEISRGEVGDRDCAMCYEGPYQRARRIEVEK